MKSTLLLVLALILLRASAPNRPAADHLSVGHAGAANDRLINDHVDADHLSVDVDRSIIHWKGTKFWGMGKHEGVVRLADGSLTLEGDRIVAGRFVVDMTTIEVTDIPKSDPIPRRRLREHLLHEDFFFVERYPTAVFEIIEVEPMDDNRHRISGRLTMRGTTHPVTFDAHIPMISADGLRGTARFSIDRHDWGVAYRGSRLTNDLVDDDIHLTLTIAANREQMP